MKLRHWAMAGITTGLLVGCAGNLCAGPKPPRAKVARKVHKAKVNKPWEAKADKNKDGVVQPKEAQKAKIQVKKKSVVNRPWEAKADTNGDGKVSAAEMRKHHFGVMDANGDGKIAQMERKLFWVHRRAKVDTALEKKYDINSNGLLEGDEAQELLKDRLRIISTEGRAKVDSVIEREYDANNDGVIDKEEAETIKDALGV